MRHLAPMGVAAIMACAALAWPAAPAVAQTHQHYTHVEDAVRPAPGGELAPRLLNLGPHTFPAATCSERAQAFINQGVNLAYGFNHAEAGRAFREAARLDPNCAMAYWGQALVLGPNINAAMDPEDEPRARTRPARGGFRRRTRRRASGPTSRRSPSATPGRPRTARHATAPTPRRCARSRAASPTTSTPPLYAESVMDLRPWGYWMPDGRPHEGTAEIVALLESTMKRNPVHPGALHFYIHLMEADQPARAEPAADRLLPLMPAAGHMVHMPSHIYQRVGRYADAVRSTSWRCGRRGLHHAVPRAGPVPMGYYPHNIHFLWWAATMDGQRAGARVGAQGRRPHPGRGAGRDADARRFRAVPYYARRAVRAVGRGAAGTGAAAGSPFMTGMWHYARGLALAAKGRLADAERLLAEAKRILGDKALDAPMFSPNTMADVLRIAPESLAGEIAAARKDYDKAVAHLERAVRLEDGLVYTEPSEWVYPPRHALGAVLLEAGRPKEARPCPGRTCAATPGTGGRCAAWWTRSAPRDGRRMRGWWRSAWRPPGRGPTSRSPRRGCGEAAEPAANEPGATIRDRGGSGRIGSLAGLRRAGKLLTVPRFPDSTSGLR